MGGEMRRRPMVAMLNKQETRLDDRIRWQGREEEGKRKRKCWAGTTVKVEH
jgi:hypothetical protein